MGKKNKKETENRKVLIALLLAVITIGIGIIGGNAYLSSLNKAKEPENPAEIIIEIPMGSSTTGVGKILEEQGVIRDAGGFKIYSKWKHCDGKLKAGEYTLSPSMTLSEILTILERGNSNTTRFTIPEGLTIEETADILVSAGLVQKDVFLELIQYGEFDHEFMGELPEGKNRLEGFLFPETYEVFTTADESDIIERMLRQFDAVFTEKSYQRAEELGYSVYDIITIASLIEREARVDEERANIASVIYNRLAAGQQLQIDATVQYALGKQKENLTYKDLEVDSPYNTYQVPALPAGPICSPGKASIEAALYPADTDYYYYVLKSKSETTHNFAKTYDEFLVYKSAYKNSK